MTENKDIQFTRRQFLQGRITPNTTPPPPEKNILTDLTIGHELRFPNGVTVTPLGVRHEPSFYQLHQAEISDWINKSDFVITESRPEKIDDPVQLEPTLFFNEVLKTAWLAGKPLLYVDPQNNLCEVIDILEMFTGLSTTITLLGLTSAEAFARQKSLRRTLLKSLATVISVAATSQVPQLLRGATEMLTNISFPSNPLSYFDYRNSGAITGINQAAQQNLIHGHGCFIVGAGHIHAYERMAQNPDTAQLVFESNVYRYLHSGGMPSARLLIPNPNSPPGHYREIRSIPLIK